jgi:hypothetical protein
MKVISLGWGVQSFALAAMSALGILPKIDAAIHADTDHERLATYGFANVWTPWLEGHGVKVITVRNNRLNVIENWTKTGLMIPAYTTYEDGRPSGMLRRQCTHDWKIAPIRRLLQENRNGEPVEMWLGITLDEISRTQDSDVQYISNVYPFLEMLDRPWTRGMVVRWLKDNGLEIPVKSACVFCPFHDRKTWREIMNTDVDRQRAIEVDQAIRNKRPGYICYLTSALKPIEDCDFSNEADNGQLSLWADAECSGMCFL